MRSLLSVGFVLLVCSVAGAESRYLASLDYSPCAAFTTNCKAACTASFTGCTAGSASNICTCNYSSTLCATGGSPTTTLLSRMDCLETLVTPTASPGYAIGAAIQAQRITLGKTASVGSNFATCNDTEKTGAQGAVYNALVHCASVGAAGWTALMTGDSFGPALWFSRTHTCAMAAAQADLAVDVAGAPLWVKLAAGDPTNTRPMASAVINHATSCAANPYNNANCDVDTFLTGFTVKRTILINYAAKADFNGVGAYDVPDADVTNQYMRLKFGTTEVVIRTGGPTSRFMCTGSFGGTGYPYPVRM